MLNKDNHIWQGDREMRPAWGEGVHIVPGHFNFNGGSVLMISKSINLAKELAQWLQNWPTFKIYCKDSQF